MSENIENQNDHRNNNNSNLWDAVRELWGWYRSENGQRVERTLFGIINATKPLPSARTLFDIVIVAGCLGSVLYAGQEGLVDDCAVQSLMSLIIGAVVGARFSS